MFVFVDKETSSRLEAVRISIREHLVVLFSGCKERLNLLIIEEKTRRPYLVALWMLWLLAMVGRRSGHNRTEEELRSEKLLPANSASPPHPPNHHAA